MTEQQIRDYLDGLISTLGGGTVIEPYYAPLDPIEHVVDLVSAASGVSTSGMMSFTFQDLRNSY